MFDRCSIIQAYDRSHYSCLLRSRLLFTCTLEHCTAMLVCHCLDGFDGCWYHFISWILSFCTFVWWNKVWKSYLILSTLWIRVINELLMSSYDWNSFISMCEDCRTLVNQLEVYLLKKQCINTKTSSVAHYEWIVKIVPALKFISSNFLYKRLCLENFNTW